MKDTNISTGVNDSNLKKFYKYTKDALASPSVSVASTSSSQEWQLHPELASSDGDTIFLGRDVFKYGHGCQSQPIKCEGRTIRSLQEKALRRINKPNSCPTL